MCDDAGRPLPEPPRPPAPREGRQHQPRPRRTSTPSSWSRSTPTTCRARSCSSGCSATWPTPRVAVVQAPQAFYNRGFGHPRAEDDPLRNEQSIFFDVICRGKDRHAAAFWCGCPSVIRREALVEVGGVATDTVVEDAHTSLRLQRAPAGAWRTTTRSWPSAWPPRRSARSSCSAAAGPAARCRCCGSSPPLFRRGLTGSQRLEYMASCLHFLEGPQRLIGLLVPPLVLADRRHPDRRRAPALPDDLRRRSSC